VTFVDESDPFGISKKPGEGSDYIPIQKITPNAWVGYMNWSPNILINRSRLRVEMASMSSKSSVSRSLPLWVEEVADGPRLRLCQSLPE
jgi:hypothetical protein